ncbi:hypothetical protein [Amnibacterium setariae]|uniref:hypothetical protein n=1 Tax=Amnibacterium setariae TaxID=2306585 RepID=UPI0011C429BE|nr:hypothetical protein [Amnibacterium setariae]
MKRSPRLVALVPYLAVVGVLLAVAVALRQPDGGFSPASGVLVILACGVVGVGLYRARGVR